MHYSGFGNYAGSAGFDGDDADAEVDADACSRSRPLQKAHQPALT